MRRRGEIQLKCAHLMREGQYTAVDQRTANAHAAVSFMRSAKAPVMSAVVMQANMQ